MARRHIKLDDDIDGQLQDLEDRFSVNISKFIMRGIVLALEERLTLVQAAATPTLKLDQVLSVEIVGQPDCEVRVPWAENDSREAHNARMLWALPPRRPETDPDPEVAEPTPKPPEAPEAPVPAVAEPAAAQADPGIRTTSADELLFHFGDACRYLGVSWAEARGDMVTPVVTYVGESMTNIDGLFEVCALARDYARVDEVKAWAKTL